MWTRLQPNKALLVIGAFLYSALFFGALSPAPASAAVGINKMINFQGKVTNPNGTNVANGSYNFDFRIYSQASGGAAIWTESVTLTVNSGIFQHNLGSVTALPGSIDFNTDNIFLGITFNNDSAGEMTPRIRFTAAPYAFNADQLDGLSAESFVQLSPGSQQTGSINISGTFNGNTMTSSSLSFGAASAATISAAASQALNLTAGAASLWQTTSGDITIQAGSGTVFINSNFAVNGNTTIGNDITADTVTFASVIQGTSALVFEGSTSDAFETTFNITNPTVDRTITFPNASGTVAVSASGNIALSAAGNITFTGTLGVGSGGTGQTSIQAAINSLSGLTTNGDLLYHNGTNAVRLARGSNGQCMTSNATSIAWGACATGVTSVGTFVSGNSYADGATISGNSIIFGSATATDPGLVNATTQTFGGNKTFDSNVILGDDVNADSISLVGSISGAVAMAYEGATADAFETLFNVIDPTADNTINIPNAGGTLAVSASGNIALSAAGNITFTGTLGVGSGGTGATTAQGAINAISGLTTNGDLLYHNGTNSTRLARGSNGQCLTANATTLVWGSCTTGAATTIGTFVAGNSYADGATISSGAIILGSATATNPGLVNNTTQSFSGDKSFLGGLTVGDDPTDLITFNGTIQGASPFTFEGLTADAFETTFAVADPTADRTITIPNASGTLAVSASGNIALSAAGNITFTGTLGVSSGGTGATTAQGAINAISGLTTAGDILYHDGSNATRLGRGANGQCLTSNASTIVWGNCDAGAVTGVGAFVAGNSYANGATVSGNNIIFGSATAANPGLVNNTTQTFGGNKTFDSNVTFGDDVNTDSISLIGSITGSSALVFEGATADAFETFLSVVDPTADNTINVPNASGTLAVSASGNIALSAVGNITFSGTLPVSSGGTGQTTIQAAINSLSGLTTNGDLLYHNGTNAVRLARGTNGQCLISNATTITWGSCEQTSVTTIGTFSGTSIANGGSISGNTLTFGPADGTNPGMVSTGTQTFAGSKTFSSSATFSSTINGLTVASNADGFTVSGGTVSRSLQVTGASITIGNNIQPSAAGAIALRSNGANTATLDAGGASTVAVGTVNASAVSIGRVGITSTVAGVLSTNTITPTAAFVAGATTQTTTLQGSTTTITSSVGNNIVIDAGNTIELLDSTNITGDLTVSGTSTFTGTVTIGTVDATGILLVLDTKNTAGDPAGTNGGTYYNSAVNKFRCFEGGVWKDCISNTGSSGPVRVRKTADQVKTGTAFANVTDLSWTVNASTTYNYQCGIYFTTQTTGTGARYAINGPANTAFHAYIRVSDSSTAFDTLNTSNYDSSPVPTTGPGATSFYATLEGYITVGASSGTFTVRVASENANTVTTLAGSWCEYF